MIHFISISNTNKENIFKCIYDTYLGTNTKKKKYISFFTYYLIGRVAHIMFSFFFFFVQHW